MKDGFYFQRKELNMDINETMVSLKCDLILFAQHLNDNRNDIDYHKLAELKSNMEAVLNFIKSFK